MQRRSLLAGAAALAALSGCSTTGKVVIDVSSQGSWPASRKPGSYAIERLPSQQAHAAEQDRIEAAALQAIEAAGFTRAAAPEQAELLIQIGALVFEVVRRDPFASSFHWRNDWWFYGPRRPSFYGPPYGYGHVSNFKDYQREAGILIRDRVSQQIVYETRATHLGRWSSESLLLALFEAAMKDFPMRALNPRSVVVTLPTG